MSKSGFLIGVIRILGTWSVIGLSTKLQKLFGLIGLDSSQNAFVAWAIFAKPLVWSLMGSAQQIYVVLKFSLYAELVIMIATFLGGQGSLIFDSV